MGNKHSNSSKFGDNDDPQVLITSFSTNQRKSFPSLQEIPGACPVSSEFDPHFQADWQRRKRSSSVVAHHADNNQGNFGGRRDRIVAEESSIKADANAAKTGVHGKTPSSDSGYNTFCVTESQWNDKVLVGGRSSKASARDDDNDAAPVGPQCPTNHNPFPVIRHPFPIYGGNGPSNHFFGPQSAFHAGMPLPTFLPPLQYPGVYPNPMQLLPPFMPLQAESKVEKKMRKKHEKEMKRRGATIDIFGDLPPGALFSPTWRAPESEMFRAPGPFPAPPGLYKAKSVDNLRGASMPMPPPFLQYPQFWAPAPTLQGASRYPSQNDLHSTSLMDGPGHFLPPKETSKSNGKRFFKDKKKGASSVDGLSLKSVEAKSSVRESLFLPLSQSKKYARGHNKYAKGEDEKHTKFEEEKMESSQESQPSKSLPREIQKTVVRCRTPPPDVIYETLKATRNSTLLTTADIEFEKHRETKENILNLSHEKPEPAAARKMTPDQIQNFAFNGQNSPGKNISCSSDHKADKSIMIGNETPFNKLDVTKIDGLSNDSSVEKSAIKSRVEMHPNQSLHPDIDQTGGDIENFIEATIEPYLPKRTAPPPENFDALTSWRALNQIAQLNSLRNQYQRSDEVQNGSGSEVEEHLTLKLAIVAPSRRVGTEPIYLEYEQRLPEFKKRLIETGSFNVQELVEKRFFNENEHLTRQDATNSRPSEVVNNSNGPGPNYPMLDKQKKYLSGDGKGSLKRLKESMAQILKSNDENHHNNAIRETGAMSKNTSRMAGDGSDIDFSWVNDLENRFKREREQFEKELDSSRKLETMQSRKNVTSENGPLSQDASKNVKMESQQWSDAKQGCLRPRYFGLPDFRSHTSPTNIQQEQEKAPGSIPNDVPQTMIGVRQKLAIFEQEAQRMRQEAEVKQKRLENQKKMNSLQSPQESNTNHKHADNEPIYIPKPDYDMQDVMWSDGKSTPEKVLLKTHAEKYSANVDEGRQLFEISEKPKNQLFNGNVKEFTRSNGDRFIPESYKHKGGVLAPQYTGHNAFVAYNERFNGHV